MKTVARVKAGELIAAMLVVPLLTEAQTTLPDGSLLISARIWQADIHVDSGHVGKVHHLIGTILNDPTQFAGSEVEEIITPPSGFELCGMTVTQASINGGGGSWSVVYSNSPPSYHGTFEAVEDQNGQGGTIKAKLTIFAVPNGFATFGNAASVSRGPQNSVYVWLTDKSNPLKIACTRNWAGGGSGTLGRPAKLQHNTDRDKLWSPVNVILDPNRPPGCPPKGQPTTEQPRCGPPAF